MSVKRIKTGIPGLDKILDGGFPESSSILIPGGSGAGKTIMCMQYIYNGAKLHNENGLLVTFESGLRNIKWNLESFGWDMAAVKDKVKVYRLNIDPTKDPRKQIDSELDVIASMVEEHNIKRLAVDSVSVFGVWFKEMGELRSMLFNFAAYLKQLKVTTMLTAETKGGRRDFSSFGVEEFVVDGLFVLYFTPPHRSIFIRKMRGTDHSKTLHPLDLTKEGMTVRSKEQVVWEAIK